MELDGVIYSILAITDDPVGYAKAHLRVKGWPNHHGAKYEAANEGFLGVVVAEAVGKRISPGARGRYEALLKAPVEKVVISNYAGRIRDRAKATT